MGYMMWPCLFQWQFVIFLWSTCTSNPFTHYKDIKGNAKCRNWSHMGWFEGL